MNFLGTAIYGAIFNFIRWRFRKKYGIQVWSRNSFRQGNFVPFLSDIDVTFDAGSKEVDPILREYGFWRKLLPVLGEANVYSGSTREFVLKYGNFFELSRDPELLEPDKGPRRQATESEAFVFLARMWAADLHNLRRRPHRRIRKWSMHLGITGRDAWPEPYDAYSLIRLLTKEPLLQEILQTSLNSDNWIDEFYAKNLHFRVGLSQTFFTEWIRRFAFQSGATDFESASGQLKNLSDADRDRLLAQIHWELTCLCTQYTWIYGRSSFVQHIRLVFRIARIIASPEHFAALQEDYLRTELLNRDELLPL